MHSQRIPTGATNLSKAGSLTMTRSLKDTTLVSDRVVWYGCQPRGVSMHVTARDYARDYVRDCM